MTAALSMSDPFSIDALSSYVEPLGWAFEYPRHSTQRLVEHLAFMPSGGRRWMRTLQIRVPTATQAYDTGWHAVSLGAFRRRRYPDLMAYNASGDRLNLLTRQQHGTLLGGVFLAKHLRDFPLQTAFVQRALYTPGHQTYLELSTAVYKYATSVGDIDTKEAARHLANIFRRLLSFFEPFPKNISNRSAAFRLNFEAILEVTHYLCWVHAKPGEILSLQATHTVADDRQHDSPRDMTKRETTKQFARWEQLLMGGYRAFGLAPLNSSIPIPSNGLTRSYYFTLEPPPETDVTFLDWSTGNRFEDDKTEMDSAFESVHFHYIDDDSESDPPDHKRVIKTYLRCDTHGHKQIAVGAALNIAFVYLAIRGHFTEAIGSSAQTWLLATPTILTAYIAERQRHYYAYATRRQRAILWIYLGFSVSFLVAVSFHLADGPVSRWDWFGTASAWGLVIFSAAISIFYLLLGYSFRWVTEKWTKWALTRSRVRLDTAFKTLKTPPKMRGKVVHSPWRVYDRVVYAYCRVITLLVIAAALGGVVAMKSWWDSSTHNPSGQTPSDVKITGTLSETIWPSKDCKDCNLKFRFVPSESPKQAK